MRKEKKRILKEQNKAARFYGSFESIKTSFTQFEIYSNVLNSEIQEASGPGKSKEGTDGSKGMTRARESVGSIKSHKSHTIQDLEYQLQQMQLKITPQKSPLNLSRHHFTSSKVSIVKKPVSKDPQPFPTKVSPRKLMTFLSAHNHYHMKKCKDFKDVVKQKKLPVKTKNQSKKPRSQDKQSVPSGTEK